MSHSVVLVAHILPEPNPARSNRVRLLPPVPPIHYSRRVGTFSPPPPPCCQSRFPPLLPVELRFYPPLPVESRLPLPPSRRALPARRPVVPSPAARRDAPSPRCPKRPSRRACPRSRPYPRPTRPPRRPYARAPAAPAPPRALRLAPVARRLPTPCALHPRLPVPCALRPLPPRALSPAPAPPRALRPVPECSLRPFLSTPALRPLCCLTCREPSLCSTKRPFARTSTMATPRVLRFDVDDRPLEFSVWLLRTRRLLESQVQSGESLWAHATGDLPSPDDPTPLGSAPDDAARARFASQRADLTAWKSRDAAACITLSSLLPESEEAHFTRVRTASEFLTSIKARYSTPTTVSLGRLFLPFLFPYLALFERSADLIAHLRSLDFSYRAACTDAQLALLPPPIAITIYFIATSLPDHLASVRDVLLLKHPSELTIEVLEYALKDVKSNLRSVASASGAVPPPLFHRCTVPQLPTFTASLAIATTDVTAAAVTTSSRSRGRGGKRGGQGTGGGGGGGVAGGGGGGGASTGGGGSAGPGEASRAAAGDPATAAGGGDARARQPPSGLPAAAGGAAAWYLAHRQQQQPLPLQQPPQQQVSGPAQRQPQRGAVHPSCTYQPR
ncbi:unnamed protein product [Closterium sp. NIES-53]